MEDKKGDKKIIALLEEIRDVQKENQKFLAASLTNQQKALKIQQEATVRSGNFLKRFFLVWITVGVIIFALIIYLVFVFFSYLR